MATRSKSIRVHFFCRYPRSHDCLLHQSVISVLHRLRYTLRPRLSLEACISPPIPSADNRPGARNPERWFINTPLQTNNPCTDVRSTNKSVCPLDNKNRLRTKRRRDDRVRTTVIAITQCTLRKTCAEP